MHDDEIVIYADGAAKGNPGPGGWGAVLLCGDSVVELGGREPHTTNNRMELTAAIRALEHVRNRVERVRIFTDSSYLVQGITGWIKNWRRRGWKTAEGADVLNRDLWEALWALVSARGERGVDWQHVRGHAGVPGNERADEIASAQATGEPIALYAGPRTGHDMDWDAPVVATPRAARPRSGKRAPNGTAYSYLSLVGDKVMRHATWAECERRVKGVSSARFKKATDAAGEELILKGWGLPTDALKNSPLPHRKGSR